MCGCSGVCGCEGIFVCVYVVECVGVKVDRVVFGSLMTSLEMAGVSLTLLKLEPGWDQYLGKGCLSSKSGI